MILMQVIGLTVDSNTKTPLVVLQDESGHEILPIWIGAMEAMAISLALSGSALPRPLTHDLMLSTLNMLGGLMEGVEIHDMRDGTYHADLLLRQGERALRVDCRPSDAIALALRVGAPIHVHPLVLSHVTEARKHPDDAQSVRLFRPQDAATDMMRQAAARMASTMAEQDVTVKGSAASLPMELRTVQTVPAPGEHRDKGTDEASDNNENSAEEQRLAEMLQMLEPDSSRRM